MERNRSKRRLINTGTLMETEIVSVLGSSIPVEKNRIMIAFNSRLIRKI
jgi:hypothetical protein